MRLHLLQQLRGATCVALFSAACAAAAGSAGTRVPRSAISDAAQAHIIAALAQRHEIVEVRIRGPVPDIKVRAGEVVLLPRTAQQRSLQGRLQVLVDVAVDGKVERTVQLIADIRVRQRSPEVRDEAFAGAKPQEQPRSDPMPIPGSESTSSEVRRGDAVTLLFHKDGIRIEAQAVAQEDARLGQLVRVRPRGAGDAVRGVVASGGVVRAEDR